MNEGFTSNRQPDEEPDPLLAALQQRLGVGYGQEPSPELWAGIRQQLPVAAPRPWWLRARRLLPLLAGLLLVSLVLVRQAARSPLARHPAKRTSASQLPSATATSQLPAATSANQPSPASSRSIPATPVTSARSAPGASAPAPTSTSALAGRAAARGTAAPAEGIALLSRPARNRAAGALGSVASSNSQRLLSDSHPVATQPGAATLATTSPPASKTRLASHLLPSVRGARGQSAARELGREHPATRHSPTLAAGRPATSRMEIATSLPRHAASTSSADLALATTQYSRHRAAARRAASALPLAPSAAATHRHQLLADSAENYIATVVRQRKVRSQLNKEGGALSNKEQAAASELVARATPTDALALRQAGLLLPASQLPAPLTTRPDSFAPHLAPVRRWALLGVAGPTLSYRTLPTSTLAYSTSPLATAPNASAGTRTSTTPDFTDLERPAAGLGAQVQVRRVLSGRWALALGLGYQEYATRLNLQVRTRQAYATNLPAYQALDTATIAVNQRDTYRFLTLPVQLSYALGPPRGRLALGLLAGAEPSWYLGGRTTENSTCSCQQQSFSSASGSPYSALSLAVSLGLDVRYRLGSPASRWQLVLQPTGRYITSALVRSSSLGYVRRQPYSFGLLTGFSWDFH